MLFSVTASICVMTYLHVHIVILTSDSEHYDPESVKVPHFPQGHLDLDWSKIPAIVDWSVRNGPVGPRGEEFHAL